MFRKRPTGIVLLPFFSILAFSAATNAPLRAQSLPGIILVDDTTDAKPPVPMPDDATAVNYDAEAGSLDFESPAPPKKIADFYREEMKKLGWKVQPTVINQDNMVNLEFNKGDQSLNFTMMKMGDHTMFTGQGDGLSTKTEASADSSASSSSSASASSSSSSDSPADGPLTAEDSNGYPIPAEHSSMGSENSLFRRSINVSISASVKAAVDFYRTELGKKGWKEQADKAVVKDNAADMVFDSPDGPVKIKITRESDLTNISLTTHDQAAASKSPLFPKPGQIKVAIGNITDKAAEVTIAGKKIKVPANVGSQKPDGPTLDLPPGKIEMAIKGGSKDSFDAGPDEIWMAMIGPGGILFVQAY